jgi:hypothetical protein
VVVGEVARMGENDCKEEAIVIVQRRGEKSCTPIMHTVMFAKDVTLEELRSY